MARHGDVAIMIGSKPPAMCVTWDSPPPFFMVYFSDLFPGDPGFDDLPELAVCLHCLIEDGDEQLGEGLDMARRLGRACWDDESAEWFYPDDAEWMGES